jgi:hypothetical protein
MNKKWNLTFPTWIPILLLPVIGLLTFGLFSSDLGFYWDDWAKTLVNVLYGFKGYQAYYASDRPLSGWTHILFVSLIGNQRVLWQYLSIFLRTLAAIGMFWSFSLLWPKAKREVGLVAVLYLLIPVFTQQPAAVTFHQQMLQACLFFFALGCIFLSIQFTKKYAVFTLLAVAANALQLTVTEYFLGILFAVPLFILIYLKNNGKRGRDLWISSLKYSLPYLILIALFILWRFFLMALPSNDPYALTTLTSLLHSPLPTLINQTKIILLDMLQLLLVSWAPVFELSIEQASSPMILFSWAISFLIAVLVWFSNYFQKQPLEEENRIHWIKQFFLVGFIALLTGMLPAWTTGRSLITDYHSNRFALPGMFGAAFIIVACVSWMIQNWKRKLIVVSLLAGLAGGYQIREVNQYRWNWSDQTTLYWQLFWRAPALKENTAIFFEKEPFENQGLFSLSSALNLLYVQKPIQGDLPYWAYTILPRYADAPEFPLGRTLNSNFRSLNFKGVTDNSIILHYDPTHGNCWWLLNAIDQENPFISTQEKEWAAYAALNRIENPSQYPTPDADLFGQEPSHNWCYFYQKAELASQYGQWDKVSSLGDDARRLGYEPTADSANSPREWIPFIKGYALSNRLEEAADLTLKSIQLDPKYQPMLCTLWNKSIRPAVAGNWLSVVNEGLNCSSLAE